MKRKLFTVLLIAFVFTAFAQKMPNTGLIAHYKFDCQNGLDLTDYSGNGNNGTARGTIVAAEDRFGNPCGAIELNGSSYVTVANSNTLNSVKNAITVTGWAYINSSAYDPYGLQWVTMVCKSEYADDGDKNSPAYRFQLTTVTASVLTKISEDENGVFTIENYNGSKLSYNKDTWHFWAMTYDESTMKVYLDGSLVFEERRSLDLGKNNEPLEIGRDVPGNTEYFNGRFDDIRIYNKILSSSEIRNLFSNDVSSMGLACGSSGGGNLCDFPKQVDGVKVDLIDEIDVNKDQFRIYAKYKGGDKSIDINYNGDNFSNISLGTGNEKSIFDVNLKKGCNYIIFKGNNDTRFNVKILSGFNIIVPNREVETTKVGNRYSGYKINRK